MSHPTDLTEFRAGLRTWLADAVPADWRARLSADRRAFSSWWAGQVRDAGYGPPSWSRDVGGPGLTLSQQITFYEEITMADAPDYPGLFSCAYTHVHDTLVLHGTAEQRAQHLGPILAGERIWAQAFSEPGAGSDLASLQTTAVRDGDAYIVNGQKTWSTKAPHADWAILLARTDREAPLRRGISYLLVDLRSPGVEVRPIKQITGVEDDFAEIFFTEVRVPVANLVGAENDGWKVAKSTLAAERGPLSVPITLRMREAADAVLQIAAARFDDEEAFAASAIGQQAAALHGEVEILVQLLYGTLASFIADGRAGPESSLIKVYLSEVLQRLTGFGTELLGLEGHIDHGGGWRELPSGTWIVDHLGSWVWTIAGGTNEVQRTIIGEHVLGLPRDPSIR